MTPDSRPPNLVLVILDGARASSIRGSGDGPYASTPALDRMRADGTTFSHAVAPGNWTIPSHFSFLTGALPWTHRIRTFRFGHCPLPTIATWLSGRGYETAVFTEEVHLIAGYGLEDGYTHRYCPVPGTSDEGRTVTNRLFGHARWVYSPRMRRVMAAVPPTAIPLTAPNFGAEVAFKRLATGNDTVAAFQSWMAGRDASRPFHALFNFVDPHEPYEPIDSSRPNGRLAEYYGRVPRFFLLTVPEIRRHVQWGEVERRYLACIQESDRKIGAVLDTLARTGELDRTVFVVTSDHGQSFGEGGNIYHGCGATDSVLRVPLLVRPPAGMELPRTVDRWVGLCDIPSWFKSAALGEPAFDPDGHPLVPFPASPAPQSPVMSEGGPASDPNLSLRGIGLEYRWNHRLIAAYTPEEKYVLDTFVGDLRFWSAGRAPDRDVPEQLTSAETKAALASVFGIADPKQLLDEADRHDAVPRKALEDRRMRSWGYD